MVRKLHNVRVDGGIKPKTPLGHCKGIVTVFHPLAGFPLRNKDSSVTLVNAHLGKRVFSLLSHLFVRVFETMDVNCQQATALQQAAGNLISDPSALPSLSARQNTRHRSIVETVSQEPLECII